MQPNLYVNLQELLMRAGAVFWLDAGVRLAGSEEGSMAGEEVERLAEEWSSQALRSGGVLAWPLTDPPQLPSAALTHPNMFTFFHTKKHNYDFQQVGSLLSHFFLPFLLPSVCLP
ncbi:hypothetical protein E2C01_077742 [Portunus trituberculatus]|uniref:Uncharacterized protein n=1 Tax=Portunus trituberculatus TaxID=210409 RepID=A0A5B7IGT2_PORTR|nr:hypothetical protein [Portunus trituberculatus]